MKKLRLFMDTHDKEDRTFPDGLTREQFTAFFAQYQEACLNEGVVIVQVNVGLGDGRAFCLTMAPDVDAVRRAHQRVGLPIASITEVQTATPGSLFFQHEAA